MDPHDPYFEHPYDGRAIARVSNQHPDPEQAAEMQRLYRGEIGYLDENFARLLDRLRELGLWENTVIALVADHGEEFQEHGGWWHGLTLYEEQIRVPLLVKWSANGVAAPRDARGHVAGLIDVAPTLIARTGAAIPETMQGVDLASDPSTRSERNLVVFAEEDHEGNVLRAIRTPGWKLIEANEGNPRGLSGVELFDVTKDQGEARNLLDKEPDKVAELRRHADAQQQFATSRSGGEMGAAELSAAEEEALRQLGYIE